jgi:hypothetical protein
MDTRTGREEHVTVDVEEARYEQPRISDLGTPEEFFLGQFGSSTEPPAASLSVGTFCWGYDQ